MMLRLTNMPTTEQRSYDECESDTESFHSAITTAPPDVEGRNNVNGQRGKSASRHLETTTMSSAANIRTKRQQRKPSSRPGPIIPTRRSSSKRRKTSKLSASTADRTLLTNEYYFSLDGILALSREFTPLPSASHSSSNSRTATRHPSLTPEEDHPNNSFPPSTATEDMQRLCTRLDEKLAYTLTYSYSRNEDSELSSSPSLGAASSRASAVGFTHLILRPDNPNNSNPAQQVPHNSRLASTTPLPSMSDQSFKPCRPYLNTIHTWTSNQTRRLEYEKIDRAYSGLRGFVRRVLPRWLRPRDARTGFFTGDCDGKSVRRFRMDLDTEEESVGQHNKNESGRANDDTKRKHQWMCFG
ncbi:hypothetical protein B0A52_09229 [Exophiala mesophila]|uniref:Uncharacterized protein n=1 Tax=Exophiala mesophila TaxID=212818 RepID=A0A438MV52_EXOME|nr:hypothetical protein B0A52_09229 [Exophiala mesophila]